MEKLFQSLFNSDTLTSYKEIQPKEFFICVICALVIGVVIALCYMYKSEYSKSFVVSVSLLPAIITVLIMLVNGNLGVAVAVGGVFSLTRFRSAQGTSKEITHIFLAMAVGLTLGLGYVLIAFILAILVEGANFIFTVTRFGESDIKKRYLKVTIPEDLNYDDIFDDIFKEYTSEYSLTKVRLTNLGTMFSLSYEVMLKDVHKEKELIDRMRERNGNLDIVSSRPTFNREEL